MIEMFRGDSRDQPFILKYKSTGDPVNIGGAKIWFTVKRQQKETDPVFQYRNQAAGGSDEEILIDDPGGGRFIVFMKPEDTGKVTGNERYWYDVQIELSGKIFTIIKDRILFKQDIT